MKTEVLSIITVCYNAETHILNCIRSISKQVIPNLQYIVIDGGSTDGTLEILKEQHDKGNVSQFISEPDTGIFNAMNKALKYAKGDFIYFLGADDFLYPEFSDIVSKIKDPNTIYYGQCLWGDMVLGGEFTPKRLIRECICHHSILYPKAVFDKYKYDEKYKIGADHLLNIQCWNDKSFKKEYHPILIANFGKGGTSEVQEDLLFEKHFTKIVLKYSPLSVSLNYLWRKLRNKN